MFYYIEGSTWATTSFYVYDEPTFYEWLNYWPEVEAYPCMSRPGAIRLGPSEEVCEEVWHSGEYYLQLPTYLRDPDGDGTWYLPEEAGDFGDEMIFIHELANHIDDHETCVLKVIAQDYDDLYGIAWGIVGGEGSPESRVVRIDLDEAFSRAAELEGGRLLLNYAAE